MRRAVILCFVFICTLAGQFLGRVLDARASGAGMNIPGALVSGLIWAAAAAAALAAGYAFMTRRGFRTEKEELPGDPPAWRKRVLRDAAVLFLAWLPCFIAYYPAVYSYDGEPQLIQYTLRRFDNHHPIAHTLFLGGCYSLGQKLRAAGIPLDGMVFCSLIQMAAMAFALSALLGFASQRFRISRAVHITVLLFYAVFPVFPVMAVSTTKDTLFTAFFILFTIRAGEALLSGENTAVRLFIDAFLMMLMRKNGLYMALGLILMLAAGEVLRRIRGREKNAAKLRVLAACSAAVLCFLITENALMAATGAVRGESAEALSIPLQQIARTERSSGDELTGEEREEILYFITEEGLENYRPSISDVVKMNFNNDHFRAEPMRFVRLWLHLGKRFPGSYAAAFLYHTMGAWYPGDFSHCTVYKDWWRDRLGYLITDAVPVFGGYDFVRKENFLPGVRTAYEAVVTDMAYRRIPVLTALFSPWLYAFGTLAAALALLLRRKYNSVLVMIPALVNYLMLLAGPCVIVRYVYPFMAVMPLIWVMAAAPEPGRRAGRQEKINGNQENNNE